MKNYIVKYIFFYILITLIIPAYCWGAVSGFGQAKPRFYEDSKQGWFWYHDPVPEAEREKKEEKKTAQTQEKSVEVSRQADLNNYTVQELWNMYPDDFQALLNVIQKKAVQYPTERNMLQYLTMQDIARRKAAAYAQASTFVTQKYADIFSINSVYPVNTPGVTAKVLMRQRETTETIGRAGGNYALLFFMQPGCGFCEKQAAILKFFQDKYGWPVKPVNIRRNTAAATRFNITTTPTLLLVKKGSDKYMMVATGVIALSELERRLYRTIRFLDGTTKEDNFTIHDYEKGSPLDPKSILQNRKPWEKR